MDLALKAFVVKNCSAGFMGGIFTEYEDADRFRRAFPDEDLVIETWPVDVNVADIRAGAGPYVVRMRPDGTVVNIRPSGSWGIGGPKAIAVVAQGDWIIHVWAQTDDEAVRKAAQRIEQNKMPTDGDAA